MSSASTRDSWNWATPTGDCWSTTPLDELVNDSLLVGGESDRRLYGHVTGRGLTEAALTDASLLRSTERATLDAAPAYADGVLYAATELDGVYALV